MNRIGVCAAFKVGAELVHFILDGGYKVEFVATHPKDEVYMPYILEDCRRNGVECVRAVDVNSPEFENKIRQHNIDTMLLLWWPDIIKFPSLDAPNIGWINLHPSLLPHGRGKHPYYWAINEGFPFGVTIHYIDSSIDAGRILFQREIPVDLTDTGESLYNKSLIEIVDLFKESYSLIDSGNLTPIDSPSGYNLHWGKDIEAHSLIDLDKTYAARDLINRIRGRTFLKGDSAHFVDSGKTYRIKTIIEEVE